MVERGRVAVTGAAETEVPATLRYKDLGSLGVARGHGRHVEKDCPYQVVEGHRVPACGGGGGSQAFGKSFRIRRLGEPIESVEELVRVVDDRQGRHLPGVGRREPERFEESIEGCSPRFLGAPHGIELVVLEEHQHGPYLPAS
ncbi:MAG: hypothetical protein GWM93_15120, partial [Gemmatimonadetes bacterium]|nr:hypothetical protein [Gemmatimonadota bacterium]NIY36565.1 hypothetical protein [Gemmatimonadota bacterium]